MGGARTVLGWMVPAVVAVMVTMHVPARVASHDAEGWLASDPALRLALARDVAASLARLDQSSFATGSERFDGEWWFGTHVMAALAFSQLAADGAPEPHAAAQALEGMLAPRVRTFDAAAWGEDPLDSLAGGNGHAAYLGYANLALGVHRRAFGDDSRFDTLNEEITEALARRLADSPSALLETYPNEIYPVDNAAVVASIAVFDDLAGRPRRPVVTRWLEMLPSRWCDPASGLLYQSVARDGETPRDGARGSGTALAVYFLSFVDPERSATLYRAVRRHLYEEVAGFGLVREFPLDRADGVGDIDSGPVVLGYGVSATGFTLAGARLYEDRRVFERLYATTHLFGAPVEPTEGQRTFLTGGPLGNAILLAMLTARPRWDAGAGEGR